jgi:hypothetical protein
MLQLDGSGPLSWVFWINLERARRCEVGGFIFKKRRTLAAQLTRQQWRGRAKAHRLVIRESLDHCVGNVPRSEVLLSTATSLLSRYMVSSCARSPHAAGNVPFSSVKRLPHKMGIRSAKAARHPVRAHTSCCCATSSPDARHSAVGTVGVALDARPVAAVALAVCAGCPALVSQPTRALQQELPLWGAGKQGCV